MARTRVILRKHGSTYGEVTYPSESEAVAAAAKMQGESAGLEALLAPATPERNPRRRKARKNPSIGRGTKHRDMVAEAIEKRLRAEGEPKAEARSRAYAIATAAEQRRQGLRKNPTQREALAQIVGMLKKAGMPFYKEGTRHEKEREGITVRLGHRKGTISVHTNAPNAAALMAQVKHVTGAAGWRVIFDNAAGGAVVIAPPLKQNPTPIDIASLDFDHFKKTVKIAGYYNVRTGRRFARVVSKDGTFVTDVPVADGGNDGRRAKGAEAIKHRAYEQLRIHLQPTTWKPSVRVNPANAGSVRYGGTSIRIHAGTYTVMPHGPTFKGPDGFVSAKKWIDTHGA